MPDNSHAINVLAQQLARQRADYQARLPAELAALAALAVVPAGQEITAGRLGELHHRLHRIAGSGGTFGLATLSRHARVLEQRINSWMADPLDGVDEETWQAFAADISALGDFATDIDNTGIAIVPPQERASAEQVTKVWLVEDDGMIGQQLKRQLESFNYAVRLFSRISDAEAAAGTERPDMLIMDVMFENERENSTEVLTLRPKLKSLECPLLFISSSDEFESRVRASQLGAEGYYLKPLDVPRLMSRMTEVLGRRHAPPQRVLIVEDDKLLAEHYRLVLSAAGMEVEILKRPQAIIDKVSSFRPELLLMDLYMPEYSGPELAGVIRQHDKWASLPIVFLSAETDVGLQAAAVGCGGDDFLTKPISDAHLVSAVRVRVDRARQLDTHISRDGQTGLLKHAVIKEAIEIELERARRADTAITLAMLDLDHFKSVNDNYGHAMGDVVISSVAMLLSQRLRRSDLIGRYGGEEFVAIMPDCDIDNGHRIMDDIRSRFSTVHFSHEGQDFTCTLSVGLASSKDLPDKTGAELLVAADEALYEAKRAGRNRVRRSRL